MISSDPCSKKIKLTESKHSILDLIRFDYGPNSIEFFFFFFLQNSKFNNNFWAIEVWAKVSNSSLKSSRGKKEISALN